MPELQIHVSIQPGDFSIEDEVRRLRRSGDTGAIVTFAGLVRDLQEGTAVQALVLEHYPGMTERSLLEIIGQAQARWPMQSVSVIHRTGRLEAGEQIVFVGVGSRHRSAAFAACEFIMDFLKTRAPFWKKSLQADGEHWVEARAEDVAAAGRWSRLDAGSTD